MDAAAIKTWYNAAFFSGAEPVEATVSISITALGQTVTIPAINLYAEASIDAIVKAWYNYLAQNPGSAPPAPTQVDAEPVQPEPQNNIVNVEQVEFRNHQYLIELYADGSSIIMNKETKQVINPKSPNAKAILKRLAA